MLQDQLWWRQIYRFRPGLRHHGLCQEIRAQVQIGETRNSGEDHQDRQKAEEGKEEQDEEGQRYQEGQGRNRWKEGEMRNMP